MQRRHFLAGAGSLGVASLAGCAAVDGSPRQPVVPETRLREGGWRLVDESREQVFEQTFLGVTVTATASTRRYEDRALADEISAETLGEVTGEMSSFFATAVTFDPDLTSLPSGVGRDRLLDRTETNARAEFEAQLEAAGLTGVERTGTGEFEVATGETARRTDYEATFSFEGFAFDVTDDERITVEGGEIPVEGYLAVWHHDAAVLVAGGAFPAANYASSTTQELTDAVTVTVDVDLGLTPDAYREELSGLIRRVR